uniref:Ssu-2 homolog, related sequence 1 n=1 Tax=Scleropages formosus TaxID=113540 RepID=A0A8C9VXQ5_SCLFO
TVTCPLAVFSSPPTLGMAPPVLNYQGLNAPPASFYGTVPGYEGTMPGTAGGFLPPPIPAVAPPQPRPDEPNWTIPLMSKDAAHAAFKEYVSGKCCYGSGPADEGVITNMEALNTYRYRLETFTESRSTEWNHEPFNGQPIDAYMQPAPGPWAIPVQPPSVFQDSTQVVKVPYTSSVKDCHDCQGKGKTPCKNCSGAGNVRRQRCSDCKGEGVNLCDTCKGKRQLLVFINLKVQWTNNKSEFVEEQSSGLKMDKLSKVTGKELFKDTQYMVYPLMGFPDPAVNQAADRLVKEHHTQFSQTARILQQRQTVELIPVTKVDYKWKEAFHSYLVYGNENKVNADDYPDTCCCTIM